AKEIGRQRYIESIIENRAPSFGYVVLANLMASNHINTIITTNFDDLVYSACTTFTGIRPIVYAYGVMASEMRLTAQRPKILKLHGDYLYSALKNTGTELGEQDANMARQLRQVLSEYGLVVVGYGGGDKSVMDVLSDISERNDLYWCIRRGEKINDRVEKLLRDKRGFLVEIEGFDEMMNEVRRTVEFDVKKMLGSIDERRNQIIEHLERFEQKYSADILGDIVEAAKEPATKAVEDKKITALEFAVNAYNAAEAKDLPAAVELYRKAIEIDPNYAIAHNNLGNALNELKRHEEAEAAYRRAIELDPNYAIAYYNLGTALRDLKRHEEAEAAYRKAIELDPNYAAAHSNLVNLLRLLKRETEALTFAERAQQIEPQSPAYQLSLAAIHKKLGHEIEADQYAAQARALLKPDGWYNLACLESVCGNADAAIENLRRAAQLENFDRDWARKDPDFEWIRDDPRFEEIVGDAAS
ncbi:MAG TPA: tetratricopeptide repeat protein, partial [Pyrinomonadaceae bacterium]|nr:tetratricopeptide repeat protein [Pyrinomonadaceae bacterium]